MTGQRAGLPDDLSLLGIDIGGSRSRARLWAGGQVAAASQGPSASLAAAGPEAAEAALTALLRDVLPAAGPLDAICVGSAGLSLPGARQFLLAHLAPLTRPGAVEIVSDAALALPAAGLDAGVAVICGTGSVAVGGSGGRTVQAGGWGYLLGDEGSGYWIVREALRALLERRDLGVPPGEMGDELIAAVSAADLAGLHRRYFEQPHVPRTWAGYAGLVLDSKDPAVARIIAGAAGAVAALASEAIGQLDSPAPLPVVLAGGLLRSAVFAAAACDAVVRALPGHHVSVLAEEPVAGAVRLAALAATRSG